jgi:S-disulfanyl-L-cysteine oxidoreductase SoxD
MLSIRKRSRRALVGWLAAALLLLSGCSVSQPGKFETRLMTNVKRRVTVRGKSNVNPLPSTQDTIAAGQRAFAHYCVSCHGLDGQATGVPFAERMSPPVPSLASTDVQAYSDGQLKWIIDRGIAPSGMPASQGILNDDEIWSIVQFIRHLPPKGSVGEPRLYQ